MNPLVYHIVSGHAFFTGVVLLILAALASTRSRPPRESTIGRRITVLTFLVGAIAVIVSSTAISYWCYAIAVVATVAWMASRYKTELRRWAPYAVIAAWLVAAIVELPYHFMPTLEPAPARSITIIGDSVTAGMGGGDTSETWPSILAREHELEVQDLSYIGETAASALRRVESHSIESSVVVVEIGGNDVLGSTSAEQFAIDLDSQLAHLEATDRQVVMFELPLPPFYNEYGRAQRAVAAKYNVHLVPKRVFLSVIAGEDSTLDTIHLSESGHQVMANTVWGLVKLAYD